MAFGTRAGVGPDKVPVLLRRGCVPESTMSCWRVRRRSERGEEVRVEGGEQGALEWSRFCAGIEDDACNAHYLRILEAVIVALVWDVRGFGDSGWDKVAGFKKPLSVFGELTATSAASTTGSPPPPPSHLHLTFTHPPPLLLLPLCRLV